MNNSVIEIISIIIKRMLKDEFIDQKEVITELIDQGYEVDDIDKAFALILSEENIIDENDNYIKDKNINEYNRVFTTSEKMYLPINLQGLIYRLIRKGVLLPEESEKLIERTIKNVYNGAVQKKDLWEALRQIINDDERLQLITEEIPEFTDFLEKKYKYIN